MIFECSCRTTIYNMPVQELDLEEILGLIMMVQIVYVEECVTEADSSNNRVYMPCTIYVHISVFLYTVQVYNLKHIGMPMY